jgi:hypothetical protein
MNTLFATKYPNNIRTVSGVPTLKDDDVVLECNTTAGPVTINLLTIPANFWSNTWRLYVIDISNNASANNITINAGAGQKINNANSLVINANGVGVMIRIINNTNFLSSSATSGGASSSFLFARKDFSAPATIYVPFTGGSVTRSVVGAGMTALSAFDSKVESGVTGFNLVGGDWTVDVTGWYSLSVKLITRINSASVDSNIDGGGASWMTGILFDDGQGFFHIALVQDFTNILCANKQFVTKKTSDINIDCSVEAVFLTLGQRIRIQCLNWTEHDLLGHAFGPGLPDCQVQIAIKRVT